MQFRKQLVVEHSVVYIVRQHDEAYLARFTISSTRRR